MYAVNILLIYILLIKIKEANMEKIIIFGVSKISHVMYTAIKDDIETNLQVCGFCVDEQYYNEKELFGLPVVKFEEVERIFNPNEYKMLVAIGYHKMNRVREEKCAEAKAKGYKLVSYISSNADVASTATVGENCMILAHSDVESNVRIGNNVCVWHNSVVAHDSSVDDNCWITSGTVIGGNSTIGKNCFFGINSTIGHNLKMGDNNFIGAGAIVTKSTDDNSVFVLSDTPKYRLDTDQFMRLFKFD